MSVDMLLFSTMFATIESDIGAYAHSDLTSGYNARDNARNPRRPRVKSTLVSAGNKSVREIALFSQESSDFLSLSTRRTFPNQ
jgi:hypothetical protein